MKIAITGASGFIGSNLARKLVKSEFVESLTCIDRLPIDSIDQYILSDLEKYSNKVHTITDDLDNIELDSVLEQIDVLYHLAANPGVQLSLKSPEKDFKENVINTFRILEVVRKLGSKTKIVFSSSAAPLAGNKNFPSKESDPIRPLSPYGAGKACCEAYIQSYIQSYSINASIFRFSNVYGPGYGKKTSVIAKMIKDGLQTGQITVYGDGEQTRDFIYIEELTDLLKRSAQVHGYSFPVHICSGQPSKIIDVANKISNQLEACLGRKIDIKHLSPLEADARENFSDPSVLIEAYGNVMSPLRDEYIDQTIKYFLKSKYHLSCESSKSDRD